MRNVYFVAGLSALAASASATAGPSSSRNNRQIAQAPATPPAATPVAARNRAPTTAVVRSKAPVSALVSSTAPKGSSPSDGSLVAISGPCDSLTNGNSLGCSFSGNINTSTNGNASFLLAENAYNAAFDTDIDLNALFTADASQFMSLGGSFVDNLNGSYTFNLGSDVLLDYFAVKGGNGFTVYEYIGGADSTYTFSSSNLSHVTFFGSQNVTAVPEPSTWATLLVGFGAAGASLRRRRRRLSMTLARTA
jgi:hypothetical protein